jgi:ribosomal protein S12 methylthiotransferase accessory factor
MKEQLVLDGQLREHPQSHERIRQYLHERLSTHHVPSGVVPHVGVLGRQNALDIAPDVPVGEHPIFPVYLSGRSVILGPLSSPGKPASPCYFCVPMRWQQLRTKPERDALEVGDGIRELHDTPFVTEFALDQIWHLTRELIDPAHRETTEHGLPYVYELQLDTMQVRRFPIIADSACPVCSRRQPDTPQRAVVTLEARRKRSVSTYRLRSPADYGLPFDAFANPVCGMLGAAGVPEYKSTTIAPVTGYLFVRGTEHLFDFFWSGHADVYDDSAILAVMEGLERHAGLIRRGTEAPIVDTYARLVPDALDPRTCGVYNDEFYRRTAPHYVQFTPDLPVPWVWGYSLRDSKPVLVPERLAYYLGKEDPANFVQECSNGCATGASVEEAILFGMLELIERDAFLLAWYGKARLPEIDPRSLRRQDNLLMLNRIELQGYDVRLFDNRIDLNVPVVTAVATRRDDKLGTLCLASGAGLDPEGAVSGALCEVATYVSDFEGRVTRLLPELKEMVGDYGKVRNLEHHPLLFGLPEMLDKADFLLGPDRKQPMAEIYRDYELNRRPKTLDLADDVRYCLQTLTDGGFDVIVVDQTGPEQVPFGLRTVCVIVPGMIPIDFGWFKQRVLNMPRMRNAFRRAGWRDTDLDNSELHLVPHPFP